MLGIFGEDVPSPVHRSRGRLTLWKLLSCCWAHWHLETRQGSSQHCHGFFRDVSPSLAVQVGINPPCAQVGLNLCYIFHWPQASGHALHCTWGPSSLSHCQDENVKLLHLKLLILDLSRSSTPKIASNSSQCSFTVTPFPSYVPANILDPLHLRGTYPKCNCSHFGEQEAKYFLQHQVHRAFPRQSFLLL